jgi:branched-chain amino acid transport system permease protein
MFAEILGQLINGLCIGMIYAAVSIGFTLNFGLMEVVNCAHGAFYMLGPVLSIYFISLLAGNIWGGVICGIFLTTLIGLATELIIFRRLYGKEILQFFVMTFGLSLIIVEIVKIFFGTRYYPSFPLPGLDFTVNLGFITLSAIRLFIPLVVAIVLLLLHLLLHKTDIGLIIRASTQDLQLLQTFGINVKPIFTFVFSLGILLAALGGVLHMSIIGVYPNMGDALLMLLFVIVVAGGLGSLLGAFIMSLIIGVSMSIFTWLIPQLINIVPYTIMIVVLLKWPRGIRGKRSVLEY